MKFDEENGLVHVRLAGSCVGCPSSGITLRNGVENMLMHYVPEVKGIVDETGNVEENIDSESTHDYSDGSDGNVETAGNERGLKFKPTTIVDNTTHTTTTIH